MGVLSILSSPLLTPLDPSQLYFQDDLTLIRSWYINGRHYSQTCNDWLKLQDAHKTQGLPTLEKEFESRGLTKEEGRVLFNRYVHSTLDVSISHYPIRTLRTTLIPRYCLSLVSEYSTWHARSYLDSVVVKSKHSYSSTPYTVVLCVISDHRWNSRWGVGHYLFKRKD